MDKIKEEAGTMRIVPVNMRFEEKRLDSETVRDCPGERTEGNCVSWACAAVRG